ncbi:MAG: hypothetical protein ACO3QC_01170 [Phycisphaerales bacterium]
MNEWIFENPWPLALSLGAAAAVLGWLWISGAIPSSASRRRVSAAAVGLLGLAGAAIAAGSLVITPGEHARAIAERLVGHAERAETDAAVALFTPKAVLNYGIREAPGSRIEDIRSALESLERVNAIESNPITRLRFRTLDATTGEVELSCSTVVARGFGGAVPTDWILRVRDVDGRWLIDRITFENLFGRPPSPRVWR